MKYILFDWGGTIAYSGTRDIFLHSLSPSKKLSVLKKDAGHTLRALKKTGIKMAIVTNTDKCIGCMLRSLKAIGFNKYFEFVIFSNGPGMCKKPCGKIFNTAIEKTGVDPSEILFVGNDFLKDIIGADRNGLNTAFLAETKQLYSFGRNNGFYNAQSALRGERMRSGRFILRSLSDLLGII